MKIEDRMDVYCKTREIMHYFSMLIEEKNLTNEERNMLCNFIKNVNELSNKIKDSFEGG